MNAASGQFQRKLTCRVRQVVQTSPQMRSDWERFRLPWWRNRDAALLAVVIAVYGIAAPIMASLAVLWPHVLRLLGSDDPVLIPSSDYAFVPMTLGLSGLILFLTAGGSIVLGPGKVLSRVAYFPIPDRALLHRTGAKLAAISVIIAVCLTPAYTAIGAFEEFLPLQWAATLACVVLQIGHCLAMLFIVTPRVREYTWTQGGLSAVGLLLMFMALFANVGSEKLWQHWHWLAGVVLATPVGWVHGAISYGVIGGQWWGWLFLAPVPVTFFLASSWWRRGYAIREVRIEATGEATAVFEWGLPNDRSLDSDQTPVLPNGSPIQADAEVPEVIAARVRKKILNSGLFTPVDWTELGFIERLVARHCTASQLAILKQRYGRPCWTRAWWIAAFAVLIPLGLRLLIDYIDWKPVEPMPPLTIVLWLVALPAAELIAEISVGETSPGCSAVHPLFPVDMMQTLAVLRRVLWLRILCWLPLLVVVSLIFSAGYESWPYLFGSNLLIAVVICRCAPLAILRPSFFARAILDFSWRRMGILMLAAIAIVVSGLWTFFVHWSLVAGLVGWTIAAGWLAGRYYDRLYRECDYRVRLPVEDQRRRKRAA